MSYNTLKVYRNLSHSHKTLHELQSMLLARLLTGNRCSCLFVLSANCLC